MMKWFSLLLLATLLTSCAVKIAPSGGAGDREPPAVAAFDPPQGTTNVHPTTIGVAFTKYVDPGVRSVVIIQPDVPFRTSYAGNEISIDLQRELDSNTTYSVTIGTDYQDTHGNKPTQAATLVFSTGPLIDTGVINGRVASISKENLVVFCYSLQNMNADTLLPSHTTPRYRVPVGTSGIFSINGLHDGLYRVMAVVDANRNALLDPNEEFGMPTADTKVEGGKARDVMLRTGPAIDVFKPYIVKARSTSTRTISVQFSENIDSSVFTPSSFIITDSATQQRWSVLSAVLEARDRIQLHTTDPLPTGLYFLHADTTVLRDSAGNTLADTGRPARFTASTLTDTTGLRIAQTSWADSAKNVDPRSQFEIRFTDAVDTATARITPMGHSWISQTTLRLTPLQPMKSGAADSFSVKISGLRSVLGLSMRDTSITRRFTTVEREDPGTISGTLADSLHTGGPYLLRILGARDSVVATTVLRVPGPWSIGGIKAGSYTMDVVLDANGNGRYDHGQLDPYRPSEYIWAVKQALRLRARWTLEDVAIVLQQE